MKKHTIGVTKYGSLIWIIPLVMSYTEKVSVKNDDFFINFGVNFS